MARQSKKRITLDDIGRSTRAPRRTPTVGYLLGGPVAARLEVGMAIRVGEMTAIIEGISTRGNEVRLRVVQT